METGDKSDGFVDFEPEMDLIHHVNSELMQMVNAGEAEIPPHLLARHERASSQKVSATIPKCIRCCREVARGKQNREFR